jgi:hypothetical protein
MNRAEIRRVADRVRAIPLDAVLDAVDAERDLYDCAKWRTSKGVISVTGAKFMNFSLGAGGGGAIDLVIHLEGMDFLSAVAWLERYFPEPPAAEGRGEGQAARPDRKLELPRCYPRKLPLVVHYLENERGIPRSVLKAFVDCQNIYADVRTNAVFLMFPDDGPPIGAEIRGTGKTPFRALAKGSRKDLGAFGVAAAAPGAKKVVLCESAIDALSCHVLHPDFACVSTAGARPDPPWLLPLRIDHQVYCGFDNDETGDAMARAMIALHPDIQRLRPPLKDWNEILRPHR